MYSVKYIPVNRGWLRRPVSPVRGDAEARNLRHPASLTTRATF
jgi:hypothetical protein